MNIQPLRIAVFSYGLPVVGLKRGGIERVAHDLADGLARRGHQVTVFTYDPRPDEAAYEVCDLPCKRFVMSWLGRRLTMGYLGNLLALVPNYNEADIIITLGDSLLLPLINKPHVRVVAGSALGEALSAKSPWRFVMQLGIYAQELLTGLTQSGCVGISYNSRRYNPFVKQVIPIGVNLSAFYPNPACKTLSPSILFVGALEGRKRGRLLMKWFARDVRPLYPTAKLMMVSPPGPEIEGVTYYTGITDTELAYLYQCAWVYASPSTYEGFGLPYVEAMASGTPVIATPNPGSREILDDGRFGLLAGDEEFGATIANLLGDDAARQDLIAKGISRAQDYALENTVQQYESLLKAMCATQGHTSEAV